jgi:hypothetical protein
MFINFSPSPGTHWRSLSLVNGVSLSFTLLTGDHLGRPEERTITFPLNEDPTKVRGGVERLAMILALETQIQNLCEKLRLKL